MNYQRPQNQSYMFFALVGAVAIGLGFQLLSPPHPLTPSGQKFNLTRALVEAVPKALSYFEIAPTSSVTQATAMALATLDANRLKGLTWIVETSEGELEQPADESQAAAPTEGDVDPNGTNAGRLGTLAKRENTQSNSNGAIPSNQRSTLPGIMTQGGASAAISPDKNESENSELSAADQALIEALLKRPSIATLTPFKIRFSSEPELESIYYQTLRQLLKGDTYSVEVGLIGLQDDTTFEAFEALSIFAGSDQPESSHKFKARTLLEDFASLMYTSVLLTALKNQQQAVRYQGLVLWDKLLSKSSTLAEADLSTDLVKQLKQMQTSLTSSDARLWQRVLELASN